MSVQSFPAEERVTCVREPLAGDGPVIGRPVEGIG
jgi:hypothetical protein